ncbi:MAG: TlpA family protein disulfide reductase [Phycisphaeraceae bacterium]|nr:TlpA family protein disulfide reductase [Phycisphaeraceae bacterium]MBX3406730.1 TlpA family protein disulfide reductase [Phycisphaeraceae bacterium]
MYKTVWPWMAGAAALAAAGCASGNKESGSGTAPMVIIEPAPGGAQREAAPITLRTGDPAPPLSIEQWLKGEPVNAFERGKVYVVEFWATWCPPCVAAIPHLNIMQKDHPSVVVIGIAGSERRPAPGQPDTRVERLQAFIAERGDGMNYRVAYDEDRSMPRTWMEPAGEGGIPCVFIVGGDGKIAWIGHPNAMEKHLKSAIAAAK